LIEPAGSTIGGVSSTIAAGTAPDPMTFAGARQMDFNWSLGAAAAQISNAANPLHTAPYATPKGRVMAFPKGLSGITIEYLWLKGIRCPIP
jgi:hypothetical protein